MRGEQQTEAEDDEASGSRSMTYPDRLIVRMRRANRCDTASAATGGCRAIESETRGAQGIERQPTPTVHRSGLGDARREQRPVRPVK